MAKRSTQSLVMPDGNEYEFFGKTYYGACTTAAATQAKAVTIDGFNSNSLVEGVKITVKFTYAQYFDGQSTLEVSGTGARGIWIDQGGPAAQYEWKAGETLDFVYNGTYWIIEGRGHATTTYYGVTKLSSTIANDSTTALTPSAVYNAGYVSSSDVLAKTNTTSYTPTADYHPATKAYVDDAVSAATIECATLAEIEEMCDALGFESVTIGDEDYTTA